MSKNSMTKTIVFGTVAVAAGLGVFFNLTYCRKPIEPLPEAINQSVEEPVEKGTILELPDETPKQEAEHMNTLKEFDDPKELIENIMNQLAQVKSEDDLKKLARLLGNGQVDVCQMAKLKELYEENRLKLRDEEALALIGEIRAGKKSRWGLYLKDNSMMQLEVLRAPNGKWKVDGVKLPFSKMGADGNPLTIEQITKIQRDKEQRDAMNYSHHFLKTLLTQDFKNARNMVSSEKISDAKIAGLCILFEGGDYVINKDKPLQAVRMTDTMSAFYANVKSPNDDGGALGNEAQFSLTVVRGDKEDVWQIDELNLDRLLEDYAKRVAGGDVYYTPLFKNPNGGETLVIYFEFDSEGLTERTKKQLDIVAGLLKLDARKKVRLSGHTDSLGSNAYNQNLSKERAVVVKAYLATKGVAKEQLVTESHGFSMLRRPDVKDDGTDDPSARRANRRTEIYLDF